MAPPGSSACTTKRYYQLAGVTVAVRDSAGSESLNYLLGDQLGSTTVSVNASGGTAVTQRYLPYGAPRSITGGSAVTDRGWIGQTKDASTELQYLNARYYDPAIGRFTAIDPIIDTSQTGSLDRQGYGHDSPVTLSDPSGLLVTLGASRRSGSYDARRPLATTGPKGTGTPTRLRLPAKTYTPVRAPAPELISVKPESVAIFNAPAGPTELAGCGCETTGGDGGTVRLTV